MSLRPDSHLSSLATAWNIQAPSLGVWMRRHPAGTCLRHCPRLRRRHFFAVFIDGSRLSYLHLLGHQQLVFRLNKRNRSLAQPGLFGSLRPCGGHRHPHGDLVPKAIKLLAAAAVIDEHDVIVRLLDHCSDLLWTPAVRNVREDPNSWEILGSTGTQAAILRNQPELGRHPQSSLQVGPSRRLLISFAASLAFPKSCLPAFPELLDPAPAVCKNDLVSCSPTGNSSSASTARLWHKPRDADEHDGCSVGDTFNPAALWPAKRGAEDPAAWVVTSACRNLKRFPVRPGIR